MKINIKKLFVTLFIFFLFLSPLVTYAEDSFDADKATVPTYVRGLYNIGLMLVGVAALVMLVYAGYLYMIGGVNANTLGKAKTVALNAISGLILLICSVLILRTINPQLITLNWNMLQVDPITYNGVRTSQTTNNSIPTGSYTSGQGGIYSTKEQAKQKCIDDCKRFGGDCVWNDQVNLGTGNGTCRNIPDGYPCSINSQCLSGNCLEGSNRCGMVQGLPSAQFSANNYGGDAEAARDACDLECSRYMGVCNWGTSSGVCIDIDDGYPCSGGNQCESGVCERGVCTETEETLSSCSSGVGHYCDISSPSDGICINRNGSVTCVLQTDIASEGSVNEEVGRYELCGDVSGASNDVSCNYGRGQCLACPWFVNNNVWGIEGTECPSDRYICNSL